MRPRSWPSCGHGRAAARRDRRQSGAARSQLERRPQYLPDNMTAWAQWLLDHPAALNRKLVKLVRRKAEDDAAPTREAIYVQVERIIERACGGERNSFEEYGNEGMAAVELLVAPTGSRKSTLMRAAAVRFVIEHPEQSVVICMPRHKLGDEQIALLRREHPEANFSARCGADATPGTPISATAGRRKCASARRRKQCRMRCSMSSIRCAGRDAARIRSRARTMIAAAISGKSRSRPISGSPRTSAWRTRCRKYSATSGW